MTQPETIAVPKALLQILFDTATGSMDFGSGFLGDDEVTALRQTADLLGVDPMLGTPEEYRKRIEHDYAGTGYGRCKHCGGYRGSSPHPQPASPAVHL